MKKYLLLISLFIVRHAVGQNTPVTYYSYPGPSNLTTPGTSFPNWYVNLEKYWFYRYRLVNDFMIIGPNAGESIPAPHRNLGHGYNSNNGEDENSLAWGADATVGLGHYLAILATEYQQLNANNWPTDRTLYELLYAQNAFNRLASKASIYESQMQSGADCFCYPGIDYTVAPFNDPNSTFYTPNGINFSCTSPDPNPTFGDGYFIRDDAPYLTITDYYNTRNWKHFNRIGLNIAQATNDPHAVNSAWGAFSGKYFGYNFANFLTPPPGLSPHNYSNQYQQGGFRIPNAESSVPISMLA